jgi:hypothetical protein
VRPCSANSTGAATARNQRAVEGLGDFSLPLQGRPCGRPAVALRPGSDATVTSTGLTYSRARGRHRQVPATSFGLVVVGGQ